MMSPKIEQMQLKLSLATPLTLPEVKILVKDLYEKINALTNEVRQLSENRPRVNQGSGKTLPTS